LVDQEQKENIRKQTIELFSGSKSFSKVAEARGYKTFTIDNVKEFNPDYCIDILQVDINKLPKEPFILWASPPCQTFSVAGRSNNYIRGVPQSLKACLGLAYVYKTLEIIEKIKPKYWFIENPMGYLRTFEFMQKYKKNLVTYCQYGDKRMKPTDIWTNFSAWIPKKPCNNGDSCHESTPRGSQKGTQGLKNDFERSKIPEALFNEIFDYLENKKGVCKQEGIFSYKMS